MKVPPHPAHLESGGLGASPLHVVLSLTSEAQQSPPSGLILQPVHGPGAESVLCGAPGLPMP